MDGGIRNGMDILIGLSYGFKAVDLGRVVAGGLGAGGYIGLTKTFELMKEDLHCSMELLGVQDISCLLYTSPSPRDGLLSRMPSSA